MVDSNTATPDVPVTVADKSKVEPVPDISPALVKLNTKKSDASATATAESAGNATTAEDKIVVSSALPILCVRDAKGGTFAYSNLFPATLTSTFTLNLTRTFDLFFGCVALAFYEKALDAKIKFNYPGENGKVMHAYLMSPVGGGFHFAVEDEGCVPDMMASMNVSAPLEGVERASGIYLYITLKGDEAVDEAVSKMCEAGARITMPPKNLFYGSRVGKLLDPYGVAWTFSKVVDQAQASIESSKGAVPSDNDNSVQ
jgi:PhnB protein